MTNSMATSNTLKLVIDAEPKQPPLTLSSTMEIVYPSKNGGLLALRKAWAFGYV